MSKLSPYTGVAATRAVLDRFGLTSKHTLGQHFLISDNVIAKILDLADIGGQDSILEVGSGIGTLTAALLTHAQQVVSVERDADLYPVLADTLAQWADRFTLIKKDALDVTCNDVAAFAPNKFVANLPYAVAATIVLDYFMRFDTIESATVMVQAEVADRMTATSGGKNYGAYTVKLSLFAQTCGQFSVAPGNFYPPPHVESSVVRLDRRVPVDDDGVPLTHEAIEATTIMADAAFAYRRKTIANSFKTFFAERGDEGSHVIEALPEMFAEAGIDAGCRAEVLSTQDFIRLAKAYLNVAIKNK